MTYCFDGATGAILWAAPSRGSDSPPTIADTDGDGQLEVLHGEDDVADHGTAVADLDEDGIPELAIGDYSGKLLVLNAEDGSVAWTMPSRGPGHYIGAPVSGDHIILRPFLKE